MGALQRSRIRLAIALISPAAIIMLTVTVYPLVQSLYMSVVKWNLMRP